MTMIDLMTASRLDLGFKLAQLSALEESGSKLASDAYHQHLKVMTNGTFTEFDDASKDSFEKYVTTLRKLSGLVKRETFAGFDNKITVSDGVITNGAHRLASLIFHEKEDTVCHVKTQSPLKYDYRYFRERGMSQNLLRFGVLKFIEYNKSCRLIIAWGGASPKFQSEIENICSSRHLVYHENILLSSRGTLNLISEVYSGEPWVNYDALDYRDVASKTHLCFSPGNVLDVYVVCGIDDSEIIQFKSSMRESEQRGKHSIHTTDTHQETKRLVLCLLNESWVHFTNFASPRNNYIRNDFFQSNNDGHENESIIYTGSIVLSVYGLKAHNDIDFLSFSHSTKGFSGNHLTQSKYYSDSFNDIFDNPFNSFIYRRKRFIALSVLCSMKINRNEKKDQIDVQIIKKSLHLNRPSQTRKIAQVAKFRFYVCKDHIYQKIHSNRLGFIILKYYSAFKAKILRK